MEIKKHLGGGSLRKAMAAEIMRQLAEAAKVAPTQIVERAAFALGITPRTLRVWKGPVDKGGWEELQGLGGMEKLIAVAKRSKAKKKKSKKAKKAASQTTEIRA